MDNKWNGRTSLVKIDTSYFANLIIDKQHGQAVELGINTCLFTSEVSEEVKKDYLTNLESYKLCYCTPEVFVQNLRFAEKVKSLSEKQLLERIVFDECHIISTWGSTFRPAYKDAFEGLVRLKTPKLLLSATLSSEVEAELKEVFDSISVLRQPIFRDNIFLQVNDRSMGNKQYNDIADYINEHPNESGIVYCVLPSDVSKIHAELSKRNINCVRYYHGQLSDEIKRSSFEKWHTDQCHIMVANSSFGLGIDKANVRFIIHARVPTSIDEYYQQCGRAGRDGERADCILYYHYADKSLLYKLFDGQGNFDLQCTMLNKLLSVLENVVQCRHSLIMIYFGEEKEFFRCMTSCGNCTRRGSFHFTDGTSDAAKVVQTVVEMTGKKYSFNILKLVLSGSRQKAIVENGYEDLVNFGCFTKSFVPKILLDIFLHDLLFQGILGEDIIRTKRNIGIHVKLGPKAHDLLAMRMSINKTEKS